MIECCKHCGCCDLQVIEAYPDMEKQDGSYTEIRECTNCGARFGTYFAPVEEWEVIQEYREDNKDE